jgi:hypothetical protein
MSRKIVGLILAVLVIATVGISGEKPWFDNEHCAMCTNMMANKDLMRNMSWEQHNIANGIVSITTVDKKYLDAYRAAHAEMNKTAMRLQQGEPLELCGSCTALGMCLMKGAHQDYVETSTGDVWIVTSDDPEVVTELQNWAKRNTEEMAKAQSMKG